MANEDRPEMATELQAALDALPERQRAVFLAIRHEAATYTQLAERFGTATDEVELAFAQALVALVKAVDR